MNEYWKNISCKNRDDVIEVEISRSISEDLNVIEKIEISNFMIKVEKASE